MWSALYVGIALLFGVGVSCFGGVDAGSEYFAGYVTEKALSVDNLFVFLHDDRQLQGASRGPAEGAARRHRRRADGPDRLHLPGRRADQLVRAGCSTVRADPADHRRQPAQAGGGEESRRRTTSSSGWPGGSLRTTEHYDGDKLFTDPWTASG